MRSHPIIALFSLIALSVAPVSAVTRTVTIEAPATVVAGASVAVTVAASTDAMGGEQIGFFHAQYSLDDGKTWTSFCFDEALGGSASRSTQFTAGPAGSKALVRVRVAFRGGKASDVDFTGAPIKWEGSWGKWLTPPTRMTAIKVVAG